MDKTKTKKVGKIVLDALLYIFLAICIFAVFVTVLSKRDSDGAAEVFGYQMRIVTSDSMVKSEFTDVSAYKIKSIPIRSMVFVKVIPDDPAKADEFYRSLKVGDVLTFRYLYDSQVTITHRIVGIEETEGGFKIKLAGDNKSSEGGQLVQEIDTSVPNNPNYVIGKVTGQAYLLGLLMSLLKQPVGIVMLIIAPCFVIILLEILKIARVIGADKKEKAQKEREEKESELEELRRKLAELEKEKAENTPQKEADEEPTDIDVADGAAEEESNEDKEEGKEEETE